MNYTAANISVIKLTHPHRGGFGLWVALIGLLVLTSGSLHAQVDTTQVVPADSSLSPIPPDQGPFNPGKRPAISQPTPPDTSRVFFPGASTASGDSTEAQMAIQDSLMAIAALTDSTLEETPKKVRKKLKLNLIKYYVKDDKPRMEINLPWRTLDYPSIWAFSPERSPPYNPKVASSRGMLIPGWGQYYNRSYWKLPIVYGGMGFFAYLFTYNNGQYKDLRQAYIFRTDDNPATIDTQYSENIPDTGILSARDQARRNRDFAVIVAGGWWALSIIEAFVDAHLKGFDVSEDLSMRVKMKPSVINSVPGSNSTLGAGFTVEF